MKNKNYIILLFSLTVFSACSDNFINLKPPSINTVEDFFNSKKAINQAIIGAYDGLQEVEASQFNEILTKWRADNTAVLPGVGAYNNRATDRFTVSAREPYLDDAWSDIYDVIHRCNQVLGSIDKVNLDDKSKKDQYIGEMKFIRAFMYFKLVKYFGGVPLVTKDITVKEAIGKGRSTVKETYNLIVNDLKDAINKLPDEYENSNAGRATKYSAEGLLGRVYVTMSGYPLKADMWKKAKSLFEDIISSGQFKFLPNYADVFDVANDNGPQCVFYVQFKAGVIDEGNPIPTRDAPNPIEPNTFPFGGSGAAPTVSESLINSYEPGDKRFIHDVRMKWVNKSGEIVTNNPSIKKFASGVPASAGDWDINWPVIRYADVLMMYAECLNELKYIPDGEAMMILNKVRDRAGLAPKIPSEIPNQQAFRVAMQKERRHEFAFENLRWNDLVRTDRALDVMHHFLSKYGLESNLKGRNQYIYPIPLQVIQVNPSINQNPGY